MILKYWTKTKRLSYISLDNVVWGVLPVRTLHHMYPFAMEQEISVSQAEELFRELEKRAWWILTDYLAKAEHSEKQCRMLLARHSFHADIADKCIALCKEKGYLDDSRFAELYIRSLQEKGKSPRMISQKLKEQGIAGEIAQELLSALDDPAGREELLQDQISRLLYKYRELQPFKAKEKIFASLYRKGFSPEDIYTAFREVQKDND